MARVQLARVRPDPNPNPNANPSPAQEGMAALGKRGWERARLSFPYLELARRAWLNNTVIGVRVRVRG